MHEMNGYVIVSAESLTRFCTLVLVKLEVPPEQATAIARNLIAGGPGGGRVPRCRASPDLCRAVTSRCCQPAPECPRCF